jgi:hypothetical protein
MRYAVTVQALYTVLYSAVRQTEAGVEGSMRYIIYIYIYICVCMYVCIYYIYCIYSINIRAKL